MIRHTENRGQRAALKSGLLLQSGQDVIVTMDTDGQHDPSDTRKLVEAILKGEADMVNGSRYITAT